MTHKLIQNHILHGRQEFEIEGEIIKIKLHSLLKGKKELDVVLAVMNPEPELTKTRLNFYSRVKCRPILSLYLNKPNAKEFNAFVNALKAKANLEFDTFAGIKK